LSLTSVRSAPTALVVNDCFGSQITPPDGEGEAKAILATPNAILFESIS
jgi:hypothetical protein